MASLLNKLCTQYYDLSPLEFDQRRTVNPEYVKRLQVNKNWYLMQLRTRCIKDVKVGRECSELISRLDYDEIKDLMFSDDFNKAILTNCLQLGLDMCNDHLIRASTECLIRQIVLINSQLPRPPHQVSYFCYLFIYRRVTKGGLELT